MSQQPDSDRLVARILGPAEPEMTCEECFAQLDQYAELTLTTTSPDEHMPTMHAHLEGCPACAEDLRSLTALLQER